MKPKTYTVKKIPETSEMEITLTIDASDIESSWEKVLAEYKKTLSVDGFRVGHAPDTAIESHVGATMLLEKTATHAIDRAYAYILDQEKIDSIGRPEVQVTKLARGNDLECIVKTAVFPTLVLPDYKKIAQKIFGEAIPAIEATDTEVSQALVHMRRERARIDAFEQARNTQKTDEDVHALFEKISALPQEELPALDDAFVATLGAFETVAAFEAHVRESIGKEKMLREEEKRRATMLDTLITETKTVLPDILIRGEARRLEQELEETLKQHNTDLATYLSHIKKTQEEIEQEWLSEGKKRALLQLAINDIAKKESIAPNKETVEKEVARLREHYKDAPEENLRAFVENQEQNKSVLSFLESQGKK